MNEKPKKKNQTVMYASVLALLASFVIVLTFIVPKVATLRNLSSQVSSKQAELDAGKLKIEDLKKAAGLIKTANKAMTTLGIAVPTKERSDEAVAELSAAANQAGVSIQSITVGVPNKGFTALTVTTSGGYGNTVTFMSDMEQNLRPATISDFSLASSPNSNTISATFNIMFPYIESLVSPLSSPAALLTATANQTGVTNANSGQ